MNCREFKGYVFDRVLGEEISASVSEKLDIHLAGCRRCRRLLRETGNAWRSLEVLETVSFPESLSRRVVERVAPRRPALRFFQPPRRVGRLALAAASLVLAAGLLLLFYRFIPSGPSPDPLRTAITFTEREIPGPDPAATLDDYLRESGLILSGLESGSYPTWGSLLSEIISRDIQGRSNYLLESGELDPHSRSVVGELHQAFWTLLQEGRGREQEPLVLPPGVDPAYLSSAIEQYRTSPAVERE